MSQNKYPKQLQKFTRHSIFIFGLLVVIASGGYYYFQKNKAGALRFDTNLVQLEKDTSTLTSTANLVTKKQAAERRAELLVKLMEENPKQAQEKLLKHENLASIIQEVGTATIEQPTKIEGMTEVFIADQVDSKGKVVAGKTEYFLKDKDGKRYELHFSSNQRPELITGVTVAVAGYHLKGHLLTSIEEVTTQTASTNLTIDSSVKTSTSHALVSSPSTARKSLIIRFKYTDTPADPIYDNQTSKEIAPIISGPVGSVDDYFNRASYGAVRFSPPTITSILELPATARGGDCPNLSGGAITEPLKVSGYNPDDFDHIIGYFPTNPFCAYGGIADVNGKYSLINGSEPNSVWAHELGHNLSLPHASSLSCGSSLISLMSGICSPDEYGNDSDVMGQGFTLSEAAHSDLNAFYKYRLNHIPPVNVQTIDNPGSYTAVLSHLNSPPGTRISTLRIKKQDELGAYYYVELRRHPQSGLPLLRINYVPENSPYAISRAYVYQFPTQAKTTSPTQSVSEIGGSFHDSHGGVKITLAGYNTSAATVQVTMANSCIRRQPSLTMQRSGLTSGQNPATPYGTDQEWDVTITNNDSSLCPDSEFKLSTLPPSYGGWTAPITEQIKLRGGASSTERILVHHGNVITDYNRVVVRAVNQTTNQFSASGAVINISPLVNASIAPITAGQPVRVDVVADGNSPAPVKTELYVDGALKESTTSLPKTMIWNTAGAGTGTHVITIKAYDASGRFYQTTKQVNL